ncbi:MAG: hypothetical protein QW587_01525 [Candidatus Bathyarchaeia archaeon]
MEELKAMEQLGHVGKERFQETAKERDDLRRTVAELEARIRATEEDRRRREDRQKQGEGGG